MPPLPETLHDEEDSQSDCQDEEDEVQSLLLPDKPLDMHWHTPEDASQTRQTPARRGPCLSIAILIIITGILLVLDIAIARASAVELRLAAHELSSTLSNIEDAASAASRSLSRVRDITTMSAPQFPSFSASALEVQVYVPSATLTSGDLDELRYQTQILVRVVLERLDTLSMSWLEDVIRTIGAPVSDSRSEITVIMQIFKEIALFQTQFSDPICAKATELLTHASVLDKYLSWSMDAGEYGEPGHWLWGGIPRLPISTYTTIQSTLCGELKSGLDAFKRRAQASMRGNLLQDLIGEVVDNMNGLGK